MPDSDSSSSNKVDDRVVAVERLTTLFKAERYVYLGLAIVSFVTLITFLIISVAQKGSNWPASLGAFGSSGVVAYSSSRVLSMWQTALNFVNQYGQRSQGND